MQPSKLGKLFYVLGSDVLSLGSNRRNSLGGQFVRQKNYDSEITQEGALSNPVKRKEMHRWFKKPSSLTPNEAATNTCTHVLPF